MLFKRLKEKRAKKERAKKERLYNEFMCNYLLLQAYKGLQEECTKCATDPNYKPDFDKVRELQNQVIDYLNA